VVELGADKAAQAADGGTALHVAARYGHVEAIRVLVEELCMDKEATMANRVTPMHVAAGNGQVEAMEVLVQLGADKDAKDVNGWTPLRWAADMGHPRGGGSADPARG
jgi:ankyrin repeat protein